MSDLNPGVILQTLEIINEKLDNLRSEQKEFQTKIEGVVEENRQKSHANEIEITRLKERVGMWAVGGTVVTGILGIIASILGAIALFL